MKFLEVILKTVETCNINCSYCYFYVDTTKENRQISKTNKKIISLDCIEDLSLFINEGIEALAIDTVKIVFHGGEPLLQNRDEFNLMCSKFIEKLGNKVDLHFGIQTNGICINSKWLELFEKYNISPGVSIDGPAKYNDVQRVDFKGQGTYNKVAKGIQKIQEFVKQGRIRGLSTISVIDARYSAKEIYYHFTKELKIKAMNFLLPDYNHETFIEHHKKTDLKVEDYGRYMCELFDAWFDQDDESIDIVFFRQIITLLIGSKNVLMVDTGPSSAEECLPVLTVYHEGSITPDDTYMTTDKSINRKKKTIKNSTLAQFVNSDEIKLLKKIRRETPIICLSCKWVKICNGGASINRYSKDNGFDNPSVYCSALKMLYANITNKLISSGISTNIINAQLNLEMHDETA